MITNKNNNNVKNNNNLEKFSGLYSNESGPKNRMTKELRVTTYVNT